MTSANPQLLASTKHDIYPFISPHHNLNGVAAGKAVLITGAGTGIGKAIAEAFAQAGAERIILAARRTEPLQETERTIQTNFNGTCDVVVNGGVDIADQASVDALFTSLDVVPDVLVQNAAVSNLTDSVIDADPEAWSNEIDINLKGTFYVCRAYLRALRTQTRRRGEREGVKTIINISSNVFMHNVPGRSSYAASKIAVNSLTEYIDNECAADSQLSNVRCVAMHPGGVADTGLSSTVSPEIRRLLVDKPALAAETAVYLSTEKARFLMGRFVNATWDMEELEKVKDRLEGSDWLRTRPLGVLR